MTSFSEAVTRRDQTIVPADSNGTPAVVSETTPHDQLVEVFLFLQNRERQFKEWRTAVEDELVRRHGDRRAAQVVGAHEVDVDRTSTRTWDVDDLREVTNHLVGHGMLRPDQVVDLFVPQPPERVNGVEAKRLIDHADGDVLIELSRCFTWKKGRAKLKVTPVAQLEP